MTEIQDLQSGFQSFLLPGNDSLPFEVKAVVDSLSFQDKARIETLYSLFQRLFCFDAKARIALTEEELLSVEEEKRLFFNEIVFDESMLRFIFKRGLAFFLRAVNTSTDEELQSVWEERDRFLKDNENFTAALDKYVQEKKQKSTAPAA